MLITERKRARKEDRSMTVGRICASCEVEGGFLDTGKASMV